MKSAPFHGIEGETIILNIGSYLYKTPGETIAQAIKGYPFVSDGKSHPTAMLPDNLQLCVIDAEDGTDGVYEIYKVSLIQPRNHSNPEDNKPYAALDKIITKTFRDSVIAAAKRLLPEQGELVPKYIPEVTFLSMVAEDCFMNNRTGNDVEKVRKGIKILKETGVLE